MSPLHVTQQGPYGERIFISSVNGLFINAFIYICQSPHKEPSHEKRGKYLSTEPQVDGSLTYNGVRSGSRMGIVNDTAISNPVPCSLQHDTLHLGLGRPEPR